MSQALQSGRSTLPVPGSGDSSQGNWHGLPPAVMEQIRSTPKQQRPQAMQALMQSMPGYDGYRVCPHLALSHAHVSLHCCITFIMAEMSVIFACCFRTEDMPVVMCSKPFGEGGGGSYNYWDACWLHITSRRHCQQHLCV